MPGSVWGVWHGSGSSVSPVSMKCRGRAGYGVGQISPGCVSPGIPCLALLCCDLGSGQPPEAEEGERYFFGTRNGIGKCPISTSEVTCYSCAELQAQRSGRSHC